MNTVTKAQIAEAKQTDIISFLEEHGIELKQVGIGEYKSIEHDSLQINSNGYYHWFSREKSGDSISLIQELFDISFQEAVKLLLDDGVSKMVHTANSDDEEEIEQAEIQEAPDQRRVFGYLCQKRKIDYGIVRDLILQGKLKQDTRGNACFIRSNSSAELHGTANQRFKGQHSKQKDIGFELLIDDNVKFVVYTESAIDMLSLYQMYQDKLNNTLLISLAGLKSNVVKHYIKLFPNATHILAVDNDSAGDDFFSEIKSEFSEIRRRKPDGVKDWNELLLDRCGA